MRDSNRTKKMLAEAMMELMQEKPFEKISVGDICERCDMNRKSFYYHFLDKYDLINWIFDTEFVSVVKDILYGESQEILMAMNELLYRNRAFYKKALQIQGQNSFSEHFQDTLFPVISIRFEELMHLTDGHEFQKRFFTDAVVMAYKRWIIEDKDVNPEEFYQELKACMAIMREANI